MRLVFISAVLLGLFFGQTRGISYTRAVDRSGTVDLIKSRGFNAELFIVNSNGAPISVYHITNPLADQRTINKYPVLYGHGVLFEASSMISRSEHSKPRRPVLGKASIDYGNGQDGSGDYALPFAYSNNNFDVWLYDARGANDNQQSVDSELNPLIANKFWDFSLDEEGLIDLPNLIDFVCAMTNSTKVVYTGYSESTFFLFALLTTQPRYQDKIAAAVLMAPVAYIANMRGLTVTALVPITQLVPEGVHYYYIPQPFIEAVDQLFKIICEIGKSSNNPLCAAISNAIGGVGASEASPTFYRRFFHPTSIKALKHFIQMFMSKRFCRYDYGPLINLQKYGSMIPPSYDLNKLRSDRIILVRGMADFLSTPEDQGLLIKGMAVKPYLDLVIPEYNHFDFMDGKDLVRIVNSPVMQAVYELMYKDGPSVIKHR